MQILIVGNFSLRDSTASALRVRGVISALQIMGHDISVIDSRIGTSTDGGAWSRLDLTRHGCNSGISVDEYRSGLLHRAPAGVRGLFLGDVTCKRILGQVHKPDVVLLYGTHLGYLTRLRQLCRSLGVPLIVDVVEWYAAEDLPGGRLGPHSLSNFLSMRWHSRKADGFIVISSRLKSHYSDTRRPTVLVPPLFVANPDLATKWSDKDHRLHLCYAGSPGKKEATSPLFDAIAAIPSSAPVTLHLVGITEEQVRAAEAGERLLERIAEDLQVNCYGRLPNQQARQIVAKSDFSLLLRCRRRSNQFGFPSKLAESMSLGTPVIANLFSDLGDYLIHRENAILVPGVSANDIASGLAQAAEMGAAARHSMCRAALESAKLHFSPERHAQKIDRLLAAAISRAGLRSDRTPSKCASMP